ncbi:MAG: transposase, partial [Mangrovibacterium sp.]
QCLPQSLLAKAIGNYIGRAKSLRVYLYDGNLDIDNNLAENAIRPIAWGRKNYLFAGSDNGAKRAAMMYSFFATCKKQEVNPYQWLHRVLEIIPSYKVNKLADLLPGTLEL